MPIFVLEESAYTGPIPEDDIVTVKVMNVKQVQMKRGDGTPVKDDDGKIIEKIEFSFTVEEPDSPYDGQRFWGTTSTTFSTNANCRLRAWAQEIMGVEFAPGYELNTDDLIGNMCRVVAGIREYQKDGETKQINYAKDVIRAAGRQAFLSTDEPF